MVRWVVVLALVGIAAAPPARLTPEQVKLAEQRNARWRKAHAEWKAGRQDEALASMQEALTLAEQIDGTEAREAHATRAWLATWEEARGNWKASAAQRERMWRIQLALWGKEHHNAVDARWQAHTARLRVGWSKAQNAQWDRAIALNGEVFRLWLNGQSARALPLARTALDLRRSLVGEKHPDVAVSLLNLAAQHKAMGDYKAALPLVRQGLNVYEEVLGRLHTDYADGLNNLAMLYKDMGDLKAALPLCQQALKLREEVLERRPLEYATCLNNLSVLYMEMGDHKAALPLLRKALKLREEALGRRHLRYADSLNNLAGLYQDMGDHRTALPLYQQALLLIEKKEGRRHPSYAISLLDLAGLYHDTGDIKAALPLYKQALKLTEEVLGRRHPEYATSLNNLASLYDAAGALKAALPLYQQALKLREEVLGRRHPRYAHSLNNLALLYHQMGRPGTALVLQEQALYLTRQHLALNAAVQSERQQRAAITALRSRLYIRLLMPDESARFSHAHVLAWKGAAFAAQEARRVFVRLQGDAATRALASEVLDTTRELALLSARPDPQSRARLEELIRLKDDKEGQLASLSAAFRAARTPPPTEVLRRLLPKGVVLVDWLESGGLDLNRPIMGQKWERRLSAWVLRADQPTVRVELGPMRPIKEAITSWRTALEKGEDGPGSSALLRKLVWSPLEKHVSGAKLVLLSPDGALSKLPFAALPGSKGGTYLIEEVPLTILPVPRLLPEVLKPVEGKPSLLTLGGVDFDAALKGKARPKEKHDLSWTQLPGTAPEVIAIASHYKGGKVALSGQEATKEALRRALMRCRFAHLATHGFFAPASMKSALERTDEKRESLFQREGVSGWHPGLLSGIVLAGANRPTDEDDGILTASEIAETDLSNLELAVLSACETGLGKVAGGEGMLGLQRAFAVAGCKSVVSSLWSVNDAATSVLMERFYLHLWTKKLSKLEALRQAQIDVLRHPEWVEDRTKKLVAAKVTFRGIGKASAPLPKTKERRSPPAWWAAWQLSGDWR